MAHRTETKSIQKPMVEVVGLEITLTGGGGPVKIIRGLDFTARQGETVSVIGASGAGKTTLLMAISGLERPTAGFVRVAGVDLTGLDENGLARFRRDNVGIVFQSFHLVPTMTALENVALPLEFAGIANARERATDALSATGLYSRLHHFPGQLSGGEQQRVALARAFVNRPALLLADEPTGNLDRATGLKVMDLLFQLQAEQETTLVMVTHDAALAERCQRQVTMTDGIFVETDRGSSI